MPTINDILEINPQGFKLKTFELSREFIIEFDRNLKTIAAMAKPEVEVVLPNKDTLKKIYLKFLEASENGIIDESYFDLKELRLLSFLLNYRLENTRSIYEETSLLEQLLKIYWLNWKDSYITGLLSAYMENWGNPKLKDSSDLLYDILKEKLQEYKGKRSMYLSIISNWNFFHPDDGAPKYGLELSTKNVSLLECHTNLQLPEHWIRHSYFTQVACAFVKFRDHRINNNLNDISNFLTAHTSNMEATLPSKLVISELVFIADKNGNEDFQNQVKDMAMKFIGDPANSIDWRIPPNCSHTEKEKIGSARELINAWITREFIKVFFDKCINDSRRKAFWLNYAKQIRTFKVFGPNGVRHLLLSDERIASYVESRFQGTRRGQVSAFMFDLGRHRMIEFSEPGYAFYAYELEGLQRPEYHLPDLHSVDNLRNVKLTLLVRRNGVYLYSYQNEGRLDHRDGDLTWEEVFDNWITEKSI